MCTGPHHIVQAIKDIHVAKLSALGSILPDQADWDSKLNVPHLQDATLSREINSITFWLSRRAIAPDVPRCLHDVFTIIYLVL